MKQFTYWEGNVIRQYDISMLNNIYLGLRKELKMLLHCMVVSKLL
jgi:hypothetical protein